MPNDSSSTLASGATQFVVQLALDRMWCCAGSYLSSLTPMTTVRSSPLAGAEMTTFLAPASRCLRASSALVKRPVDSTITSQPRSPQGSEAGSFSAETLMVLSPTRMPSSVRPTSSDSLPSTVSYFSRCASVLLSVRSLTATTSTSVDGCASTARKKFRPIRPNPLTPTRVVTAELLHAAPCGGGRYGPSPSTSGRSAADLAAVVLPRTGAPTDRSPTQQGA